MWHRLDRQQSEIRRIIKIVKSLRSLQGAHVWGALPPSWNEALRQRVRRVLRETNDFRVRSERWSSKSFSWHVDDSVSIYLAQKEKNGILPRTVFCKSYFELLRSDKSVHHLISAAPKRKLRRTYQIPQGLSRLRTHHSTPHSWLTWTHGEFLQKWKLKGWKIHLRVVKISSAQLESQNVEEETLLRSRSPSQRSHHSALFRHSAILRKNSEH